MNGSTEQTSGTIFCACGGICIGLHHEGKMLILGCTSDTHSILNCARILLENHIKSQIPAEGIGCCLADAGSTIYLGFGWLMSIF